MREKQKRIDELELEISEIRRNYREAEKFHAERRNLEDQKRWRPWQVMAVGVIVPTVISLFALITALSQ